jgi:hypothetical protein
MVRKRLLSTWMIIWPHSGVSFSIVSTRLNVANSQLRALPPTPNDDSGGSSSEGGLILNGLDREMNQVASKSSFSAIDVLAAAKKRAQERPESRNEMAGDGDWKDLAEEKKDQFGEIDDWENSMKEAGNVDSQILMLTEPTSDDEGPKLLLF